MGQSAKEIVREQDILLPFLKWAGGKRWLTNQYPHLLPTTFERYVEPFLGSGAVLFHLRPQTSIISDRNPALINTYVQLRDRWEEIYERLVHYQNLHSKQFYYEERSRTHTCVIQQAAQFLYLNRTCWNGLYRVNLSGSFNVPIGTKSRVLLNSDRFEHTSDILRRCDIKCQDFEITIMQAQRGDFVFIDPPYVTRHNFNGFVKYNDQIFSWDDQIRLRDCVEEAARRGATILLTNADHDTIRELYAGLGTTHQMHRQSVLAGSPTNRGPTTELAVLING